MPQAGPDDPAWVRLARIPHRFFFLAGVTQLALACLLWLWMFVARTGLVAAPLPSAPVSLAHAVTMLYAYFPFFMFGFLFTAGPRWLGVPPPPPSAWRVAGLVAWCGAALMLAGAAFDATLLRAGALVYAAGWAALLWRLLRLIRASTVDDRVHARIVAAALAAGVAGLVAFGVAGTAARTVAETAGLWLFLVPVFVTVCHRMIPFFTASVLPLVPIFRPWWLLALLVGAPVAHGLADAAGLSASTWIVDLPAALVVADLCRRWGLAQSFANRLLAMLHLGFVWYAIAFALFAVHSLCLLAGVPQGLGLAPLHALTMGFCGSLLLAMVSRVTCGHSGRVLAADRLTWTLFLLLQVAVVARLAATASASAWGPALAIVLWSAALLPWIAHYAPVYWRPRADGRPG